MKRTTQIVDDLNLNILNKSTLNLCIIASKHIIGDITHDETKLSIKEIYLLVRCCLAYSLVQEIIFPIHLGQTAGENVWLANWFSNYSHWATFSRYSSDWYLQNKWRLRYFISSE